MGDTARRVVVVVVVVVIIVVVVVITVVVGVRRLLQEIERMRGVTAEPRGVGREGGGTYVRILFRSRLAVRERFEIGNGRNWFGQRLLSEFGHHGFGRSIWAQRLRSAFGSGNSSHNDPCLS